MRIKARGELITPNDQVNLIVQYRDQNGDGINADSFPTVSIIHPSGLVLLAPTSMGVANIGTGRYSYIFTVPIGAQFGIYADVWVAYINGFRVEQQFSIAVMPTDVPAAPNSDGYVALGDDPGFHYSQLAIKNINKLLKILRARLNSRGKAKSKDSFGNDTFVDCDIFSTDQLVSMLAAALMDFNQVPYFTMFTFDDCQFVDQFGEILVEGATLYALSSQALIEKGSLSIINDNGVTWTPPDIADMLQTQYNTLLTQYYDKLKYIKNSLRPASLSLGVFGMNSGINPAARRLRHVRERKIF